MEEQIKQMENKINKEMENKMSKYVEKKEIIEIIEEEKNGKIKREMMTLKEIKQIENWTKKKCGEIIFDSNKDDWNVNTSTFDSKLLFKEKIIFLIEDINGNKFGCYSHEIIDKKNERITDSNFFLFSLKSNGRFLGMTKIPNKSNSTGFGIYEKGHERLTEMGHGAAIGIYKQNKKSLCYCNQYDKSYDYHGVSNVLCGEYKFTPKRFIVIQMK